AAPRSGVRPRVHARPAAADALRVRAAARGGALARDAARAGDRAPGRDDPWRAFGVAEEASAADKGVPRSLPRRPGIRRAAAVEGVRRAHSVRAASALPEVPEGHGHAARQAARRSAARRAARRRARPAVRAMAARAAEAG